MHSHKPKNNSGLKSHFNSNLTCSFGVIIVGLPYCVSCSILVFRHRTGHGGDGGREDYAVKGVSDYEGSLPSHSIHHYRHQGAALKARLPLPHCRKKTLSQVIASSSHHTAHLSTLIHLFLSVHGSVYICASSVLDTIQQLPRLRKIQFAWLLHLNGIAYRCILYRCRIYITVQS